MKPKGPKPGAQRADGGGGILGDGEAILPTSLRVWESGVRGGSRPLRGFLVL